MDINFQIKVEEIEMEEANVMIKAENEFEDIKTELNLSTKEDVDSILPFINISKGPDNNGKEFSLNMECNETISEIKSEELMLKYESEEDDSGTGAYYENADEHDMRSIKKINCDCKNPDKSNLTVTKKYNCNHCDYQNNDESCLNGTASIKRDKSAIKKFTCNHCDYKTNHKSSMSRHVLARHDKSAIKKFNCNHCDYKTNDKGKLNQHVLTKHNKSGIKKFNCNHCDYKTNDKSCLKMHVKRKHDKRAINTFNCSDCDYKTNDEGCLNEHVITKHSESGSDKNCSYFSIFEAFVHSKKIF